MSSAYTQLPTSEDEAPVRRNPSYMDDPRFREPPVAAWKRAALIAFIIFLIILGFRLRTVGTKLPGDEIVYADRYSDKHKYRPAASPIIRRRLPDGRLEIRGDYPRHRHNRDEL